MSRSEPSGQRESEECQRFFAELSRFAVVLTAKLYRLAREDFLQARSAFAEVAKGILASGRPVRLGMLPTGTANDQGKSFGLESGDDHATHAFSLRDDTKPKKKCRKENIFHEKNV